MGWTGSEAHARAEAVAAPYHREAFRRYHGEEHPREMLAVAGSLGLDLDAAQGLAVVFHDAVCAPGAPPSTNEEASASLLLALARGLGVDAETAGRAADIVRATDHVREPSRHALAVVDLDLLRLALPYERFLANSDDVFFEWSHLVPDRASFMRGRAGFLAALAERPSIYRLGLFDEAAARGNIARFVSEWS